MTNAEIDALPAGRELDALVAERVMGLGATEPDYPCGYRPDGCSLEVPDTREEATHWDNERSPVYRIHHENGWNEARVVPFYSTEIAAAWKVWEKLRPLDCCLSFENEPPHSYAIFRGEWKRIAEGETAPLAICRAALKAVV